MGVINAITLQFTLCSLALKKCNYFNVEILFFRFKTTVYTLKFLFIFDVMIRDGNLTS